MIIYNLQSGDKITGLYYGVFFRGTVLARFLPMEIVTLDSPVKVFGMWHYYIKFYVRPDKSSRVVDLWSIEQGHNFHMADRFEQVEADPRFAAKLYREMWQQSVDRIRAATEIGNITGNYPLHPILREIEIRDACKVLIRRYPN